jgi:transcriptional regulator with XRE-family HTH domain
MTNSLTEELSQYVRRIMRMKRLTLRDVEVRSKSKITDGYISGIINGAAKNPSVEKVMALAMGLGVAPEELFYVACGLPARHPGSAHPVDPSLAQQALELMHKVLINPDLMDIMQEAVNLPPTERERALRSIKRLNDPKTKARRTRGTD